MQEVIKNTTYDQACKIELKIGLKIKKYKIIFN